MSSGVAGIRLSLAFLRYRITHVTMLVLLGFVLGAAVIGLGVARASAERAILDSVRADVGHQSYAMQTGNPNVIDALRGRKGVTPVRDDPGDAVVGDLSAAVLVRTTTSASVRLGILTQGARPAHSGEVLLSEWVARSLGVKVGDTIQVRIDGAETPGRVVGFSADPADKTTSTLVRLMPDTAEFRPTIWLGDGNFYRDPGLKPIVDSHQAATSYQSIDGLLEAAARNQPRFLSAMRFVPAGCGLLLGVVIVAVGTVLAGRWRLDVEALTAAGMAPARGWRRVLLLACGAVLAGEIVGGCAAAVALGLWRVSVSSWVGQRWVDISVPWREPIVMLGLTLLVSLLAVPLVRLTGEWVGRLAPRPARRPRGMTAFATLVVGAGLIIWAVLLRVSLQPKAGWASGLASLIAGIVAAAIPFVIAPLLCSGLPAATRSLVRRLVSGMRPVAAVGAVVVLSSALWTAQTTREANAGEAASSPLEPAGSFVISAMPDTAVAAFTEVYRSHGGSDILQFAIPDEPTTRLRATSPKVLSCMTAHGTMDPARLPSTCLPSQASAPINVVLLGPLGSTPSADPNLLENGKVVLLAFSDGDPDAKRSVGTSAEADSRLGGNLPGLVVPPDSAVAKQFGLTPGGTSEVVLLDFARLTPHDQFFIRATAMRLAPGAQTADGSDPTAYDRLRSVANTVGFLGGAAAMVVTLLGGISMVVAHALTRRTLIDLGAVPGLRRGIVARWTAVPAASMALTMPLAILTASSGGQDTDNSYGLFWIMPGVLGVMTALVIGVAFLRVPQQSTD